jgi:hypothetical protein
VSSAAIVANPARGQRRCLQFLNALGQRDALQAASAADPRNTAITYLHGFAGGHQGRACSSRCGHMPAKNWASWASVSMPNE